jgi:hypothetical protein
MAIFFIKEKNIIKAVILKAIKFFNLQLTSPNSIQSPPLLFSIIK